MLSLSTSFGSSDCRDGAALVQAVADAGFNGIELEYRIESPLFHRMLPELERTGLKVVSIHNYFPIPSIMRHSKGGGDLFLLSHPDKEERLEAIKWTTRTIEHANNLEATAVVLHCGRVEMAPEMKRLRHYFDTGRIDSEDPPSSGSGRRRTRSWRSPRLRATCRQSRRSRAPLSHRTLPCPPRRSQS